MSAKSLAAYQAHLAKQYARKFWDKGEDPKTMAEMRALIQATGLRTVSDDFCMLVDDEMIAICERLFGKYSSKPLSDRPRPNPNARPH